MAVDPTKVGIAITGVISKGLTSATAPTSQSSALTGFSDVGGISEDGVTLSLPDNGDATPIKVWQNGATVRTVRQSSDDLPQLTFTMVETNLQAVQTFFDVTVTQTATEGSFSFSVANRTASSYVLDIVDGTELGRYYVPQGVVSSVGEITFNNTDAIGYQVTLDLEYSTTKAYNFKTWLTRLHT